METCVVESHKMYLTTPKSVTFRKHVLHEIEPGEFVSIRHPSIPLGGVEYNFFLFVFEGHCRNAIE